MELETLREKNRRDTEGLNKKLQVQLSIHPIRNMVQYFSAENLLGVEKLNPFNSRIQIVLPLYGCLNVCLT